MRYPVIAIFLLSPLVVGAAGTDYFWNTTTSSSWNDSVNWSPNGVPGTTSGIGDSVTFPNVVPLSNEVNLDISTDIAYLNQMTFSSSGVQAITNNPSTSIVFQGFSGISPAISVAGTSAGNITIYPPLTLEASLTITQGDPGHTLTLGSFTESGGSFGVSVAGAGTTIFSGMSTYSNATSVGGSSTLKASGTSSFSPNSAFTVSGTLDLSGNNNTIDSLSGTGTILSSVSGTAILSITDGGDFTGTIENGGVNQNIGLAVQGGTLILNGTSTYSGSTIVSNNGILQIGSSTTALSPNSIIVLQDSAELNITAANTYAIPALNGGTNTQINFDAGGLNITAGGTFNGQIIGPGSIEISGGTLILSNSNSYSGGTTIDNTNSATLQLTGVGSVPSASGDFVHVNGTLDITEVTSGTQIGYLLGSGAIALGGNSLTINQTTNATYSGTIGGSGGSLSVIGGATLNLSGSSSYTGSTSVASGTTLKAGAVNTFAPVSAFTVAGTLDLAGNNNQIGSLSGSGTTQSTVGAATLTILNGGTVTGTIIDGTGPLSLTLSGGTLSLSGANSYTGTTTINGGILALTGSGVLSSSTSVVANGTFDISNITSSPQTITNLTGTGSIVLGNNGLTIQANASNTFNGTIVDGAIADHGSITYSPGSSSDVFTLGAAGNTYTGTTTITSGTWQAGVPFAFAPASAYTVAGTLDLNNFANTIATLSGSGTVTTGDTSGILTITGGGTFSGGITGPGGVALTGGTLSLTTNSSANSYSGTTTVSGSSTILSATGSALSSSSAVSLSTGATLTNAGVAASSNTILSLNGDSSTFVDLGLATVNLIVSNGGSFAGIIKGAGNFQTGGTLTLSNANSFTGGITTNPGSTLILSGSGNISNASGVTLNGKSFNITGISSSSTSVNNLTGSAAISIGDKNLIIVTSGAGTTYSGNITGTTGGLSIEGNQILTLSGSNSYRGETNISGFQLTAGSTSALAPLSDFNVDGYLALNGFSNTIKSLSGGSSNAQVQSLPAAILTITNGGSYAGGIANQIGLNLIGGTLSLTGSSTYVGNTTIATGATLSAGSPTALSIGSPITVSGTLLLNNVANSVYSLNGAGTVNTGTITTDGILTIGNGGTFSGGITELGGLNLTGGTLTLSTASSANTYTGPTTISSAILAAGGINAFAPGSNYTLTDSTLALNSYSNTIANLTGDSTSQLMLDGAILTINGGMTGTFAGSVSNSPPGGLTISGGSTFTLSGTSSYYGPTTIVDGTLIINANGALSPNTAVTIDSAGTLELIDPATANSCVSVLNSGILSTQEPLTLSSTYTQALGANLTLGFDNTTPLYGQVLASTGITLNGSLDVINTGIPPSSGIFTLLDTTSGSVTGEFSSFTPTGFTTTPYLSYSLHSVSMFFAGCSNTWTLDGNGNWNDGTNWGGGCVPGVNGNLNDVATFINRSPSNITVTLANDAGNTPQPLTLFQLNLNASSTSYTLSQYSNASTITLDAVSAGTPTINVIAGSHEINAPIILNQDSDFFLTDGVALTLGSNTTLTSTATQELTIAQSNTSTTGSGLLVNNGSITPYDLSIVSASVENNDVIIPTNSLTVAAASGKTTTVSNTGTDGQMGTSGPSGSVQIGGAGTTTMNNIGIAAAFGPTGINSTMTVGSTGSTTITNNGIGATFGPSGSGGSLAVTGLGTTVITNSGSGVIFGATGTGGNVTISSGSISNTSGALVKAGSGGVLTINGGSITNDVTSKVGAINENVVFTSGFLNTSGDVLALDYTQGGSSILQLNLTSVPTIYGNVAADGMATVGSTLIINALSGSITSGQSVDLITAAKGVLGTYSTVNYLNFPVGMIPQVIYLPNAVELVTSATVTNNSLGSFAQLPFTSVNEENILIQREVHTLSERIRKRNRRGGVVASNLKADNKNSEIVQVSDLVSRGAFDSNLIIEQNADNKNSAIAQVVDLVSQSTTREQHLLTERIVRETPNPSRVYFGPTDSFGSFNTKSTSQVGFGFNSVGLYTGADHAFDDFGLGGVAQYTNTKGCIDHNSGYFNMNQIQGSGYATWIPPSMQAFAVDAIIGYGYEWFKTYRKAGSTLDTVHAKGHTHGMLTDALLGVEYFFSNDQFQAMPNNLFVTPLFNVQYIWSRISGYNERDAGVYNLHINSQIAQSLKTTLGARFEYLVERTNFSFKPELDLAWQYEYLDHGRNINFSTLAVSTPQSISNSIVGAGRNTLLVGVDFFFTIYKVFELETSYDLQWNDLYINNTFYLGIGGNF